MKTALLTALGLLALAFTGGWAAQLRRHRRAAMGTSFFECDAKLLPHLGVGFITNAFDALGVGAFAPTTALYRLHRSVPDELIPGTLNVGDSLPTIVESFIFVAAIAVEARTLVSMIAAAMLGAWFGAGRVSAWPKRKIQLGLGLALLTGLYAPCMILVSLLGMNPRSAFPIMMGSCAFLMPVGGYRFIRAERYTIKAALGLTIGGIPGVLLGAYVLKQLPLTYVRWLVVLVALYTSFILLRSAARKSVSSVGAEVPADG